MVFPAVAPIQDAVASEVTEVRLRDSEPQDIARINRVVIETRRAAVALVAVVVHAQVAIGFELEPVIRRPIRDDVGMVVTRVEVSCCQRARKGYITPPRWWEGWMCRFARSTFVLPWTLCYFPFMRENRSTTSPSAFDCRGYHR